MDVETERQGLRGRPNEEEEEEEEKEGEEEEEEEEEHEEVGSAGSGSSYGDGSSSDEEEPRGGVEYLEKTLQRIITRRDSLEEQASLLPGSTDTKHRDSSASTYLVLYLAYQSLGVVYGDMGTSPMYVYNTAFNLYGVRHLDDILGALSLILYTLVLSPLIKYVFIVLRANDNGEGGTFALYSLVARYAKISIVTKHHPADHSLSTYKLKLPSRELQRSIWIKERLQKSEFSKRLLLFLTLFGTSMVIGDGTITPSISVLSAVSGLRVSMPNLSQNVVVVVSIIILVLLFSLQRFGTSKVGFMFAPALCIWFISIGCIGVYSIFKYDPYIFRALNPMYIVGYFQRNGKTAWLSLGGIVLCITGTEAMFADLGHFSVKSIQIAFTTVVFPSLVAAYAGQAAYLMNYPGDVADAFYKSIPRPVFWPMFLVATVAAVIASQAMISASFSVMKQCEALGCFPRVNIVYTSKRFSGQIYIPEINWLIMILCVVITAHFRDTQQLGNAYGVAVVTVMFLTTIMMTLIMLLIWQTHLPLVLGFFMAFGSMELMYISSVMVKVLEGGWVPLVLAVCFLTFMYVWHYGTTLKTQFEVRHKVPMSWLYDIGPSLGTVRVPGICLVYNELIHGIPAIFHHLVMQLPAIHSLVVFVCIRYLPVATVPQFERVLIRRVGPEDYHMYRCVVRYGYRDMRTETARTFEQLLLQSLEIFIRKEAQSDSPASETPDSSVTPLSIQPFEADTLRKPLLSDEESSAVTAERVSSSRKANVSAERKHISLNEKLSLLSKYKEAGVVYMLGHGHVSARKDSFFLKKLVVNYFYTTLRRNCRRRAETLNIPGSRSMQIGMTYFV